MFPSKYPVKLCAFYDDINTGFSKNLAFFSEIMALEIFDNQSDDIKILICRIKTYLDRQILI